MAMWVIGVDGVAPCQRRWPGGQKITSPARISSIGPSSHCVHPQPAVTTRIWPSGCECQAVRAPGSKVTLAQAVRAGAGAVNSGSMRTEPVNHSAGPCIDGWEPLRLICMDGLLLETDRPLVWGPRRQVISRPIAHAPMIRAHQSIRGAWHGPAELQRSTRLRIGGA